MEPTPSKPYPCPGFGKSGRKPRAITEQYATRAGCAGLNLPNYLTISRIVSIPLLIWILSTSEISSVHGEKELLATAVFALAAITDRLDGYLARKRGQVTRMGMLLDPLADKLLIASALVVLVQFNPQLLPAWIAIAVLAREIVITDLRVVAAGQGLTMQARDLGKWKMGVQVAAVIATILAHRWPLVSLPIGGFHAAFSIEWAAKLSIWAMLLLSVASAVDYFGIFWSSIGRAAKTRPGAAAFRPQPKAGVTVVRS
jgi:CDP-diacylglycerol---glycerol-3-phosphate 3-phosphatidyltransferase